MKRVVNKWLWVIALALFCASTVKGQDPVRELRDIINMRASGLDRAMTNKGYSHIKTDKSNTDSYSYWWNRRSKKCVTVRTGDGIVKSAVSTLPGDCNQPLESDDDDWASIIDMRASGLDNAMANKGYNHIKTDKSGLDSYSYWWNNRSKNCVSVRTSNGRVKSAVNTLAADCNKSQGGSDYNHRDDTEKQAYLKGYFRGKRSLPKQDLYTSNIQINAYSKGYKDGYDDKPIDPYYRENNSNSGNRGEEKWRDLDGWVATSAYDVLQQRGFKEVRDHQSSGKTYRVWYNRRTRQCIKTLSVDKKIKEIIESNRCD